MPIERNMGEGWGKRGGERERRGRTVFCRYEDNKEMAIRPAREAHGGARAAKVGRDGAARPGADVGVGVAVGQSSPPLPHV